MADVVEVLVPGGRANPGPPLGPSLGPLGINIKKVVDEINVKTKDYNGMTVPVKIIVDASKNVYGRSWNTTDICISSCGIEDREGLRHTQHELCRKPDHRSGYQSCPSEEGRDAQL